jgi:mannose-1-phosphate guanylyltransferase
MTTGEHTWALVLAAGEGSRLRRLTTTSSGVAVPKQYCSLHGGLSLLHESLRRAGAVAAREHICTVVAEQHREWWEGPLQSLPRSNIIVQPQNRGTANGILLPLLHILERDPDARVVLLPSDHYVRDEEVLARSLRRTLAQLQVLKRSAILLGIEPDDIDPELGYIVPGEKVVDGVCRVERFVEKPSEALARELIFNGALWNAFIIVTPGQALLDLLAMRMPDIVTAMCGVVAHDSIRPSDPVAARRLYRTLPEIDFSRHVAQGCETMLRVAAVPACGWSDLGTPARVEQTLRRIPRRTTCQDPVFPLGGRLDLAAQQALLQVSC